MFEKFSFIMSNLRSQVSGLRSQGLSFSRDGLDISLDVPDTRDVKDIFGTMAVTIETQDDQLTGLHKELEETSSRHKREQAELLEWYVCLFVIDIIGRLVDFWNLQHHHYRATKKFEEMQKENDMLKAKLDHTKREFKNFSYNIQGFDDDHVPIGKEVSPKTGTPIIAESPSKG